MALYLGLDSSTQGIKALLVDPGERKIVTSCAVNFEADLPEYACHGGVLPNEDPLVKHSDPLMWLAALDLVLARLHAAGAPMEKVEGIGGSGQQHGSVYLNDRFFSIIESLRPGQGLPEQLKPALARATAPIWMDSSTGVECAEITVAIGPALQTLTGSPAVERFTGPQIRKFWKTNPEGYGATQRIHLVSSFLCSVLCGADAPVDSGDGAGMNLANLDSMEWDPRIARATAPGLRHKLPKLVAASARAGGLSPYFKKYGLKSGIAVAAWTGDNPASLVGSGAVRGQTAVVSLGTSDTFFAALENFKLDPEGFGHVFGNPAGGFMSLTCFKNGSLARERVKNENGVDWEFFGQTAFEKTVPGNEGRWALPWFESEITPLVTQPGLRANFDFAAAAPEVQIRAVVEAQAMSLRIHSLWMGEFRTIRVTGGASQSEGILQTLANVFNAKVELISTTDSAALGAALIAAHVAGGESYESLSDAFCPAIRSVIPCPEAVEVYQKCLPGFREFASRAI